MNRIEMWIAGSGAARVALAASLACACLVGCAGSKDNSAAGQDAAIPGRRRRARHERARDRGHRQPQRPAALSALRGVPSGNGPWSARLLPAAGGLGVGDRRERGGPRSGWCCTVSRGPSR